MSSTPEGLGSVVRRDHRIDLLRGAAIAVVLILHFHLAYNLVDSSFSTVVPPIFIHALARNGNYGVTVFFVISGFLITSTSVRRFGSLNAISLRSFYTFRFARIYPCLLLELFLITSFGLAGWPYFRSSGHTSFLLADLSVLTFWHNVLMAKAGYFNYGLNVLWSLSVEEVFYLIFPLLCLLLRKEWRIVSVWVLAILYGPFYRSHNAADDIHYLYGYFACFDAVALGCCTAIMARRVRMRNSVILAVQFAAAVFMVWIYLRTSIEESLVFGPTLIAGGAAVFLLAEGARARSPQNTQRFRGKALAWLGRHSYELYLFHIVVLALMRNVMDKNAVPRTAKPWWFLLFLFLSVMAAGAISRWYSEPLNLRLRRLLLRA